MPRPLSARPLSLSVLAALSLTGTASVGASGGPAAMTPGQSRQVIAQSDYRCRGGIRVHVTQMPDTARVDFAGRSQTLDLTPGANGVSYSNDRFTWFSRGRTSYMRDARSGTLALTDCVATGQ